jgi:glycosyltransferase involved in cell wall biosynthesis
MSTGISVILITKNEEKNIVDCLQSVAWSDDIVIVDAESTDRTVELARTFTERVFVEPWRGFAGAKTSAMDKTLHDWILWVDSDERVTPELAEEIARIFASDTLQADGYRIARRAYFLGKWIRHCGWYPGHVLRLFRKSQAKFTDTAVHESLILDGTIATLRHDLLHFTDDDLDHYFEKFNSYTTLGATDLHRRGRTAGLAALLLRPSFAFFKMYLVKRGFLDGMHGLILCILSASYVFAKYAKLWHLGRSAAGAPAPREPHGRSR